LGTGVLPVLFEDFGVFILDRLLDSEGVDRFLERHTVRTDVIWIMTEFVEACEF
jgi:hypothetical protein